MKSTPFSNRLEQYVSEQFAAGAGEWTNDDAWFKIGPEYVDLAHSERNNPAFIERTAKAIFRRDNEKLLREGEKIILAVAGDSTLYPFMRHRALVALGNGGRIAFGDMRMNEYLRAAGVRFEHVKNARNGFRAWNDAMAQYQSGWKGGLSVKEIDNYDPAATAAA